MKQSTKLMMMAVAIASTELAQAQLSTEITLTAGSLVSTPFRFPLSNLSGSGTLSFSDDLIGALAVAGIQTSTIHPATGLVSDTDITIGAPIYSLSGTLTSENQGTKFTLYPTRVGTLGGAMMVAPKANFATSGGSLSVTDLSVDLATQGIYATVSGANGLTAQQIRVWDFASIAGDTAMPIQAGVSYANNKITGLTITDQAFDLFAQGLGLKAGGIAAMASITDYGVIASSLSVDMSMLEFPPHPPVLELPVVPEPSTYLMMGLGLLGLGIAARRQRA